MCLKLAPKLLIIRGLGETKNISFSHFSENHFLAFFAKIYEYDEIFRENIHFAETDRVRWFSRKWKRWDDFVKLLTFVKKTFLFPTLLRPTHIDLFEEIWKIRKLTFSGNGYIGFLKIKLENFRKTLTSFFITAIRMVDFSDLWKSTFFMSIKVVLYTYKFIILWALWTYPAIEHDWATVTFTGSTEKRLVSWIM